MAKKSGNFFEDSSRKGVAVGDDVTLYSKEIKILGPGERHTAKTIDIGDKDKEKFIKEVGVQLDLLKEKIEPLKERVSAMSKRGIATEEVNDHLGRAEGFLKKIDVALASTFDLDKVIKLVELIDEMEERVSGVEQLIQDMEKLNTSPAEKFSSLTAGFEELKRILFKKQGDEKNVLEKEMVQFSLDLKKENARSVKIKPEKQVKLFAGFPERLADLRIKIESLENDGAAQELKTDDEQKEEGYQKAKTDLANFAEDIKQNAAKEYFSDSLANLSRILNELQVSIKEDGPLAFGRKLNNFNSALESAIKSVATFKEKKSQHEQALRVFGVFVQQARRLGVLDKFENERRQLEDILENLFNLRNSSDENAFAAELNRFHSRSEVIADKVAEAVQTDVESVPVEVKTEITPAEKIKIEMRLENAQKRTSLFADVIMAHEPPDIQREAKLLFIKINNFLSQAESLKDNSIKFNQKIVRVGELLQEIINLVKDETREEFNKQWEHMKKGASKTPDTTVSESQTLVAAPAADLGLPTPDIAQVEPAADQNTRLQGCQTQLGILENLLTTKASDELAKRLKNQVVAIKGKITKIKKEKNQVAKEKLLKSTQESIFSLFTAIKNSPEGAELLENLAGRTTESAGNVVPQVENAPSVTAVEALNTAPDTVSTQENVAAKQKEEKDEIEHRREMIEMREKKFLRHIIDTMSGDAGLAQEIRNVHEVLKEALKNISDTDKFEQLLAQYEQEAAVLMKKINEESDSVVIDTSDLVPATVESLDQKVIAKREQEVSDCEDELEVVMKKVKKELPNYNFNDELDEIDAQIKLALASTSDPNKFEAHMTALRESIAEIKNAVYEMLAPKKSFWAKAKEKLFGAKEKAVAVKNAVVNKEVAKTVVKVAYDSVTSVLGLKLVTDVGRWVVKGDGDLADYFKGKKRASKDQKDINDAYQNLLVSFEKSKKGETLSDEEQVPKRIKELKEKIENSNASAEAKKQILDRLWAISIKHQDSSKKVEAGRDKEVKKLLDGYIHGKVEGVKIAKDALNLALTATGLSVLRGIMYAGTSLLEKARKGSREFAQKTSGTINAESENTFVKNALVKSAQETVRGIGATEGADAKTRVIDFIKAAGVVARTFGISSLALTGGDHNQTIDQLIEGVEKNGWSHIITEIPHNFSVNAEKLLANLEKTGHVITNPTESVNSVWNKVAGTEEVKQPLGNIFPHSENNFPLESGDLVSYPEAGAASSEIGTVGSAINAFAAEHQLTERSAEYLAQFDSLKDHPESLNRILEASHVNGGALSHFTGGKIDNLIEAGGERRAVIFEELWKNDKAAAIDFLNKQEFSRAHLSHFAAFADKKGNVDFGKFVESYNPDNKKMSLALFKAMQGKENTELANAGFVRAATADHAGRTIRLKGDVVYMGLDEKGQPILSGDGKVSIVQTKLVGVDFSKATASDALSTDDKLWENANVMRSMRADGTPFDGNTQNVLPEFSPKGVGQFLQGEAAKARSARMGEEHIGAISRPIGSNSQDVESFDVTHLRDKEGNPIERRTAADQSLESPVPENAFELKATKVSSREGGREVFGKTVQTFEAGKNIVRVEGVPVPVVATSNIEVENASVLSEEPNVSYPDGSVAPAAAIIAPEAPLVEKLETVEAVAPVSNSDIKPVAKTEVASDVLEMTAAQKDYVERLGKIFNILTEDDIAQKMSSFTFKNGADNRLYDAIENEPAFKNFRDYFESISNNKPSEINTQQAAEFEALLNAYVARDQDWYKMIEDSELRLMLDPSENLSMMANNSHSIRIWDPGKKEELFITNPKYTFVLKNGSLLKMDGNKVVDTWKNYKEALATAKESSNMNR